MRDRAYDRVVKAHEHLSLKAAKLYALKLERECELFNRLTLDKLNGPFVVVKKPSRMDILRSKLVEKNFVDQYIHFQRK